ncbi:MAG: hypothetical protein WBA93_17300 [Microcoleaceae cyanobacterium]
MKKTWLEKYEEGQAELNEKKYSQRQVDKAFIIGVFTGGLIVCGG